jgi:UDP-2-acetamido-2,6-beta-L-arabino-hexul-4-ose reductase
VQVLITGANGFIAKNLLAVLRRRDDVKVLLITRESSDTELLGAARAADFVFHLAGVNRTTDENAFNTGNAEFTRRLCQELRAAGKRTPIVYSSSTQATRDNAYGRSKLAAENDLKEYHAETGAPVALYRLPNVFGKWCRPNYNSAVATFCHNIARDLPIQVHDASAKVTLVYVDDVVESWLAQLQGMPATIRFCDIEPVYESTVGEIASLIRAFKESRSTLVTERVGQGLVRALYATYVSCLPTQEFSYDVPKYGDPRGVFVEMLKTRDSGQFSFFTAHPGITRGGHYHHSKTEKFLVIKGRARFGFRHILSDEKYELYTSGEQPRIVETVPGWAHDITNVGEDEMIVMLWANEIFDRQRPDTFIQPV